MRARQLILTGISTLALLSPLAASATVGVASPHAQTKAVPVAGSGNVTATTTNTKVPIAAPVANTANVNVVQTRYVGPPIVSGATYTDYRQQLSSSGGASVATAADAKGSGKAEIDTAHFASKLIGASIEDSSGRAAGTVDDIVLEYNGTADKVLIKDNGYFGKAGQIVALDYKLVDPGPGGKNLFKPFEKSEAKSAVPYPDKNSVRGVLNVSNLHGAPLKGPTEQTAGKIEDIGIDAGKADTVIIAMDDKTFGLGGTKAVMNFTDTNIVNKGANGTFVQFNAHQADVLKLAKKSQ